MVRVFPGNSLLKPIILMIIIPLGVWVVWPKQEEPRNLIQQRQSDVRHTIKFFPGFQYMPGSIPYGLGKPLRGATDVITDFERRFTDTRIEVISVPSVREYLVTQLSTGEAPDIIMATVEDIWPDVQKEWYIPLDRFLEAPNPFVLEQGDPSKPGYVQWWDMFKYQAISRAKAAPDGLYYCLTFDLVETGIFYNKDLFREIGLAIPKSWEEFLDVLAKVKAYRSPDDKRIIPLLVHLDNFNSWATDLFFDQVYYDLLPGIDLVKDPVRGQYLNAYLDWDELTFLHDKGFFTERDPRYVEIWPIMHEFAQYCNRNLLADLTREFVTQRGAMLWNISAFSYRLAGDAGIPFDWGVFYLPRFTPRTSEFASGEPMCVVGGPATAYAITNTAIGDTAPKLSFEERIQTSQRLKRVIAFLQFLTLPRNYARVVNEYPCFMSNIVGVDVLAPLRPFEKTLRRRYTSVKWIYTFDLKFSEVQRRMLELYLTNGISLDEFLNEWQIPNVDSACARAKRRKNYDPVSLESAWRALADVRKKTPGLPK